MKLRPPTRCVDLTLAADRADGRAMVRVGVVALVVGVVGVVLFVAAAEGWWWF